MPLEPDGGGGESQEQLATVWDAIGDIFANLGETVASVPIIGGILSTPFRNTASKFYLAGETTRAFREFYDRAIAAFEALAQGETWDEILDIVFPEWETVIDFVTGEVESKDEWYITQWIRNFWKQVFPWAITDGTYETRRLWEIILDPVHWLRSYAPWAYQLWFDLAQFDTWEEFFVWLKEMGIDFLDPIAIIRSVLTSVFRWIQEHIPTFTTWLVAVGEQVLRYALEGKYVPPEIEPPVIE